MSATLLQVDAGKLLSDSAMTVLIGLVVVFGTLLVLTFVFWLFGVIAGLGSKKNSTPKAAPAPKPAPKAASPAATATAPVVEDGISDEIVAAIAAAIAAMSDGTTHYAVRRISAARSQGTRPVWAAAGIADNTQPF